MGVTDDDGATPPASTDPEQGSWRFIFTRSQQTAILIGAGAMALATLALFSTRAVIDEADSHRQTLLAWGLSGIPLGMSALVVSLVPMFRGLPDNRRFWRWWYAGDLAAVSATTSVALAARDPEGGLPVATLVLGALILPLWGAGGVEMLRQKSGARTVGIDLVDTAVAVVTIATAGAYVLVGPILGAEDSGLAVPFAICMVGAPAGLYLAFTNFARLQKGARTPQGIAIGIAAAMYTNVGYQAANAVRDFSLPLAPGVALQLAAGYLLLSLPLFTHAGEAPGLDRLPLARQVRRASPLFLLPLVVLPLLTLAAWNQRVDHPNRVALVMVVTLAVLGLASFRSLLANRETRRLYGELEAAAEELEHRASHDELTGLMNRRRFSEVIDEAIGRQVRSHGPFAVLYVDLDGFKAVNDTLGHKAGDDVLREVASRLRSAVRHSDTAARLGGDEFVLLCESAGSLDEAEMIAARVVEDVAQPIMTHVGPTSLGASVGVAYVPADAVTSPDALLHEADKAMYDAKEAGRGRVVTRVLAERDA